MNSQKLIGIGVLGIAGYFGYKKFFGSEDKEEASIFGSGSVQSFRGAPSGGETPSNKISASGEPSSYYTYEVLNVPTKKESTVGEMVPSTTLSEKERGVVYTPEGGVSTAFPEAYGVTYDSLGQGMSSNPPTFPFSSPTNFPFSIPTTRSIPTKKERKIFSKPISILGRLFGR